MLMRLFAWLGRCGTAVFAAVPRSLWLILRGTVRLAAELLRLAFHGLQYFWQWLRGFIRRRTADAAAVAETLHASGKGKGYKAAHTAGILLLSKTGIVRTVLRFAVPVTCCMLLLAVVRRGMQQQYAVAVSVDGRLIGTVANETEYHNAQEIVYRRLSYVDEEAETGVPADFTRTLQLKTCDSSDLLMTAGELADEILKGAGIALTEGWGVYVNDEFQGAVTDTHPIEAALARQLSGVSNALAGTAEDVYYADKVTYEAGSYLAGSVVDAQALANKLTQTEHSARTYTAGECDSVYTVAERFSTTPEEIRRMNPDVPDAIPNGYRTQVPVVKRYLPIIYTKKANAVSFIDYDTKEVETAELREGETEVIKPGVKGETEQKVLITYTDGAETSRKVLSSRLVQRPQTEELGVGTYAAQPYSTDTVIDGNGKYAWPVDGGWISAEFGGESGHWGMDIAAAGWSDIYAAESGVVKTAGWNDSYGFYIVIDHGDGYETLYAHCVELLVEPEEEVRRGQLIALVGTTGHSTGFHMHFEVRHNGLHENPKLYLRVNAD